MLRTRFGATLEESAAHARQKITSDLQKLGNVPQDVVKTIFAKVIRNYPCNIYDLAEIEAKPFNIKDPSDVSDAVAAAVYVWDNSEGESPKEVIEDLKELQIISERIAPSLVSLLEIAAPLRENAKLYAAYSKIGSATFDYITGTVDIRCRFHDKIEDFNVGKQPNKLVATMQVILASLGYRNPDGEDMALGFQMDEHDLHRLKRFVETMEKELELAKGLMSSVQLGGK